MDVGDNVSYVLRYLNTWHLVGGATLGSLDNGPCRRKYVTMDEV